MGCASCCLGPATISSQIMSKAFCTSLAVSSSTSSLTALVSAGADGALRSAGRDDDARPALLPRANFVRRARMVSKTGARSPHALTAQGVQTLTFWSRAQHGRH